MTLKCQENANATLSGPRVLPLEAVGSDQTATLRDARLYGTPGSTGRQACRAARGLGCSTSCSGYTKFRDAQQRTLYPAGSVADLLLSDLGRFMGCRCAAVSRRRMGYRMRFEPRSTRFGLLDHGAVLADARRSAGFFCPRRHAADRERRDCRSTFSRESGTARRQEPPSRVPAGALLRLSECPGADCTEAAQNRIAGADRRLYGKGGVQLQSDAEGVSGGNGADPGVGLSDGIAERHLGRSFSPARSPSVSVLLFTDARSRRAGRARKPSRVATARGPR